MLENKDPKDLLDQLALVDCRGKEGYKDKRDSVGYKDLLDHLPQ